MREVLGNENDSYDWAERMNGLIKMFTDNIISPAPTTVMGNGLNIEDVFKVMDLMKRGSNRGKIVLKIKGE